MTQHALISWCEVTKKIFQHQIFLIVFQKIVCSLLYYKYNLYLCISKIDNGKEATYRYAIIDQAMFDAEIQNLRK